MITAAVRVGSSLLLEPARELLFPLPDAAAPHQRPCCTLSLTNLSPCNDVIFRVRTRHPDAFTVRPTYGAIAPGASCRVVVAASNSTCDSVRAMDAEDMRVYQSSELFLVQSVERACDDHATASRDRTSSTWVRECWQTVTTDRVTEHKLVCRFAAVSSGVADGVDTSERRSGLRSLRSTSASSDASRSSRSGQRSSSMSAAELPSSRSSGYCERRGSRRSWSNYSTSSEPTGREGCQGRHASVDSDASFYTTIEPPEHAGGGAGKRMPGVTNGGVSSRAGRRGTVLTNDTMVSARSDVSVATTVAEPTRDRNSLLYHIQPDDALLFDVKPAPRMWGSRSFFIVNSSPDRCLMFRVRTSNQSGYVVKPSRGLVSATNALEVTIWICAPRHESEFDPTQREAKDSFLVEVANVTWDKYDELMNADEQKRTQTLRHLWTLVPRSERESTMLAVKLKMDNSITTTSSARGRSADGSSADARSKMNATGTTESRIERTRPQVVASVVEGLKKLSTSVSTGVSTAEGDIDYRYSDSDSDESVFTIAPTAITSTATGNKDREDNVADDGPSLHDPPNPTVIVVSADRMDTVDFSNPQLSFFI
ncbi:unnamed protein product [Hyaloperonospora brassicae]|uniref:MSP domain-containing protein n=1 Tax=Hyaloperonospora brassicae TaxID=162125 RepID=A0AAV0T793_HYABA|nr:unnamed protein product [Hyaloperonospora brassicae]